MKIKLCGIDYTVHFYEPGELIDDEGNILFGQYHSGEAKIQIGRYGRDRELETARHEVAHAYLGEALLGWDEFTAEDVCLLIGKYGQEICDKANRIMK